jgi:maltose alpha-D-glucosyltransferase/alpha-amylase
MQYQGTGLRRRAAPMLDGDQARLRMAWSLLFSLPGTPVLLYGDEIGLGENLAIDDRVAVRVPMQWSAQRNGGFTDAETPVRPLAVEPFDPSRVNVADQGGDPDSLLSWMRRLTMARRERPELGWGSVTLIDTEPRSIFAHRSDWQQSAVVAVHNLGGEEATVTLDLGEQVTTVRDVLEAEDVEVDDGGRLDVHLGRYGCRWLHVVTDA